MAKYYTAANVREIARFYMSSKLFLIGIICLLISDIAEIIYYAEDALDAFSVCSHFDHYDNFIFQTIFTVLLYIGLFRVYFYAAGKVNKGTACGFLSYAHLICVTVAFFYIANSIGGMLIFYLPIWLSLLVFYWYVFKKAYNFISNAMNNDYNTHYKKSNTFSMISVICICFVHSLPDLFTVLFLLVDPAVYEVPIDPSVAYDSWEWEPLHTVVAIGEVANIIGFVLIAITLIRFLQSISLFTSTSEKNS